MSKFLKNLFFFFCCLLGINILMFCFYFKFYNDYVKCETSYNKVFFGDSHCASLGDYTNEINTFNFSDPGDSYFDMYRKLNFLKDVRKIDTVYLIADKHTVSTYREIVNNNDRSVLYTSFNDYQNCFEFFKNRYIKIYVPFFNTSVRNIIRLRFISIFNMFVKKSFVKKEKVEWCKLSEIDKLKLTDSRIATQFGNKRFSNMLASYLEKIILIGKENNIKIIAVKFPVTNIYYYKTQNNEIKTDSIFKKYDIEVLEFETLFLERDSLFTDQDHLNSKGAQLFVDKLKKL